MFELENTTNTFAKGGKLKYNPSRDVVAIAIKDGPFTMMFTKGDFLGGAYQMEKGGSLENYLYVSPRKIIFARLKSGEDIKPINGFYIRKDASGTVITGAASKPLKKANLKSLKISIPRPILLTGSPSKSPKMMKFIGTFSGKDPIRPAMSFVQVKEGSIVATDANKLIRIIDGSTLNEDTLVCESRVCKDNNPKDQKFPNWTPIVNSFDSQFSESYDMVDLYEALMQVRNDDLKNKVSKTLRVIELKLQNVTIYFNITLLLQCVKGCLLLGWKKVFISYSEASRAVVFTEENVQGRLSSVSLIMLMPIFGSDDFEKVTITPKVLLEQGGMVNPLGYSVEWSKDNENFQREFFDTLDEAKNFFRFIIRENEYGYKMPISLTSLKDGEILMGQEFAKGGRLLTTRERYILELKGLAKGLRSEAIDQFIDDNDLTNDEILNTIVGLGRKQISQSDFVTALVGKKDNVKFKNLMVFIKSDKALRMADGGEVFIPTTYLDYNPDYLVGTNTMYEMFADGGIMAKGGAMDLAIVNPEELYKRLGEAEKNFTKDNGAEYKKVQKEIEDNRISYFKKLSEAEMNFLKDNGAEYQRLIIMRDKFADGGMMAKGGGVTYKNLLLEKPSIVNETKIQSERFKINEIDLFRKSQNTFSGSPIIRSSADSVKIFREFWDEQSLTIFESFNVMLLNQANKVIGLYQHSKGGVTGTVADAEMVVLSAVKSLAKGVIISHNHPSGNLRPSQADIEMTNKIKNALKFVDVLLLDSIIITENSYYSFADEGIMALGGMTADGGVIPYTKNFLKGMQSIKVNGLGGYMPGVRNIYWDKKDEKFYLKDFSGDYIFEIRNGTTLKEIDSLLKKSKIELERMADGGMMADGGLTKNNYQGQKPDDVWNTMSKGQREKWIYFNSFLIDERKGQNKGTLKSKEMLDMAKKNFESLDRYTREEFENQIRNNQNGIMAKGGKIREFDDVLIISKNKLGMVEAIADNIYYVTTPFGESFEAALDDLKKVVSFAPGGSLQGHGFEVGDRIAEDLGGYIRVVSEDGKDYFIKLKDGDRLTEPPLPFKDGGKVKTNDLDNKTKFQDIWQEKNKEGFILKVGNTELKSNGPGGLHYIYKNGSYWGRFTLDGNVWFVEPDDGKDFFVEYIDLIIKRVKADSRTNQEGDEDVDLTEFYEGGGNIPKVFDVPAQFLDAEGKRKNDRKTIKELTDFVLALPQTKEIYYNDELGDYTPSRKKLHAEIINKFKKEVVCINNDQPIAIFMGGSPASGKSSFLRKYSPFLLKEEILKIDADEIRAMLPEYEGWNACQTHLETKDIVNILLSNKNIGIPCDFDIIYDGTMNSVKSYIPLMEILRKRGYKIFIVFMDNVPKDVIIKRALERYKTSGRFVPLEVIEDFFSKGKTAFNELKKDVDGYMLIDGSSQDYKVIEEGGIKLPRDREYSKLGTKIKASDIPVSYKKGGLGLLY